MRITKLIPCADFALEHPATTDYEWQLANILRYASFIKQKLSLWMIIPCDEENNVLIKEPIESNYFPVDKPGDQFTEEDKKGLSEFHSALLKWEKAHERCFFKDFVFDGKVNGYTWKISNRLTGESFYFNEKKRLTFAIGGEEKKTIEDLCNLELLLSDVALNLIYRNGKSNH